MADAELRAALDEAIIKHIKSGNPCHPKKAYNILVMARKYNKGTRREQVVDGRLKALRLRGVIVATRWKGCGWALADPD